MGRSGVIGSRTKNRSIEASNEADVNHAWEKKEMRNIKIESIPAAAVFGMVCCYFACDLFHDVQVNVQSILAERNYLPLKLPLDTVYNKRWTFSCYRWIKLHFDVQIETKSPKRTHQQINIIIKNYVSVLLWSWLSGHDINYDAMYSFQFT